MNTSNINVDSYTMRQGSAARHEGSGDAVRAH